MRLYPVSFLQTHLRMGVPVVMSVDLASRGPLLTCTAYHAETITTIQHFVVMAPHALACLLRAPCASHGRKDSRTSPSEAQGRKGCSISPSTTHGRKGTIRSPSASHRHNGTIISPPTSHGRQGAIISPSASRGRKGTIKSSSASRGRNKRCLAHVMI